MDGRGRPIRPFSEPTTALKRFAWLIRASRAYHPDDDVRATRLFAQAYAAQGSALKPETLNKLERGHVQFNTGIVRTYEKTLGLEPWSLVDAYVYSARLEDRTPIWGSELLRTNWDLLHDLAQGHDLDATELLQLCASQTSGETTVLHSSVWTSTLVNAVLDKFAISFERDERLLREALILLGERAIPEMLRRAARDPLRYFNAIEALGFCESPLAWEALVNLASLDMDPVQAQTLIEPLRRWLRRQPALWPVLQESSPGLAAACLEMLADPDQAFTAREEALALIGGAPNGMIGRRVSSLDSVRSDLVQLRIQPTTHSQKEFADTAVRQTASILQDAGVADLSPHIDGLSAQVRSAVYDIERVDRLGAAALLAASPSREAIGMSLGSLLHHVDREDYGVQRSIVRVLTKARTVAGNESMSRFAARTPVGDEGLRLALTWALGLTSDPADRAVLSRYFAQGTQVTKQVALLSWSRRGFSGEIGSPNESTPP